MLGLLGFKSIPCEIQQSFPAQKHQKALNYNVNNSLH